jgi:hypothetical protein
MLTCCVVSSRLSQLSMERILFVGKVQLFELVKGLGKKAQHNLLKKQIRRVEKREKVLDVPLPRHQLEQVSIIVLLYSLSMEGTPENEVIMPSAALGALTCCCRQLNVQVAGDNNAQCSFGDEAIVSTQHYRVSRLVKDKVPLSDCVPLCSLLSR